MELSLIAAISTNYAIGKNNSLPWHLSNDLKIFKDLTTGYAVIMGRKTFDSIGKPLPGRLNIILSNTQDYKNNINYDNLVIARSLNIAIEEAKSFDKIFLIGGQQVFKEGILIADKLYITKVDTVVNNADAFFPKINTNIWQLSSKHDFKADKKNDYNHSFCTYIRK